MTKLISIGEELNFLERDILVYASSEEILFSIGAKEILSIKNPTKGNPWKKINSFIEKNKGEYIVGYLGFDLHRFRVPNLPEANYPAVHLFVPREVKTRFLCGFPIEDSLERLDISRYTRFADKTYERSVKKVLRWIDDDAEKRATIARKIELDKDLNLNTVLRFNRPESKVDRLFYLKTPHIEIAGLSPELLAQGNPSLFKTYKLSGTAPVLPSINHQNILNNQKLLAEHESSIKRVFESLSKIGNVALSGPQILKAKNVFHLLTEFKTQPFQSATITNCLRAVFPSGVFPYEDGLKKISEVELDSRGAYYGLIGLIRPDESFEFSQIIRSFFKERNKSYVWVGAAITKDSTPQGELEETILKLHGCPFVDTLRGKND
ncbi:chorismate-binding protein [Candidatus Woesearchaeota archaeon]|nr:chorismate-binding protein [Candidatus Woesearchaeota archaeon]